MKSIAIATVLAAAAFSAAASHLVNGEVYPPVDKSAVSTTTRAQVLAELRMAQAQGTIAYGNVDRQFPAAKSSASQLSRADVQMELVELARDGKLFKYGSNGGLYRN